MNLIEAFSTSTASLVGREHARLHRNNQDGVALAADARTIAAVVCDGCGEGNQSEVGARLSAAFLARWLQRHAIGFSAGRDLAEAATAGLEAYLRQLAAPFDDEESRTDFVRDALLSTFLAAAITEARVVVFGVGDGVGCVNGRTFLLDPGPENAPAYVGYRVVPHSALRYAPDTTPVVHFEGATARLSSLLLGTDGLLPLAGSDGLSTLAADPRFSRNPSVLQRRLVVLGVNERQFADDATAVLIQRRAQPEVG